MGEALIVVDDEQVGARYAGLLREKGYAPLVWTQPPFDAARIAELQPELIILDIGRSGSENYRLCERLKLTSNTNLIPIVEVLHGDEAQPPEHGFRFSPNAFVRDPASAEQLQRAIEEALAWRGAASAEGLENEIDVHLHSDVRYLDELNKLLREHFRQTGLDENEAKQLTMAVRELGANAIEWGHRRQVERIVTIHCRHTARKLTVLVRDTGPGFNPCDIPHAANDNDPISHMAVREELGLREGGFGIMIANGLVDEMRYNECGNEVCLVKHFGNK